MSSPESISSSSTTSDDSDQEIVHQPPRRHDSASSRRIEVTGQSTSQRPLPDLPSSRPPASRPESSHSGHMLAAILRDRPLPHPLGSTEQSAEERRRSLIALDRKRRLTNSNSYEEGRRRTNSGGFHDRRLNSDAYRMDGPGSPPTPRRHASSDANISPVLPEVIDLTGSSPEPQTPRRNRPSMTSSESSRRYMVPRWQPDSEVGDCPICKRPFTWMFRRHHCRKCGRVVCNDCSPHRITIPRQFIVHPPGLEDYTSPRDRDPVNRSGSIDSSGDDAEDTISSPRRYSTQLEGGEKVRLCNPCVPDPQPDPPPNYSSLVPDHFNRDISWSTRPTPNIPAVPSETRPRGYFAGVGNLSRNPPHGINPYIHQYHRSSGAVPTSQSNTDPRSDGLTLFGSFRGQSSPSRYRMPTSPNVFNTPSFPGSSSRDHTVQDPRTIYHRPRQSLPENRQPRDELFGYPPQSNRPPRPLHELTHSAAVRQRISENDLCPICRHALPPLGPNGEETAREAHIVDCINSRDPSYHAPLASSGPGEGGEASSSSQIQTPYRLHMLTFTATEKDCVSQEDGQVQECSICMVEYDVGDELARLECLCKFHRACIMEWVERKAECPVHKLIG